MGASIVIGVIVAVFIAIIGVNVQLSLWLRGFRRGAPAEGRDGDQVRRIMSDRRVREVFFVGHGGPHFFRLGRGEILYYCAFADAGLYGKELVHQVHCGGPGGISLIERVVPVENRHRCFYIGREIRSRDIEAGFERLAGFWGDYAGDAC